MKIITLIHYYFLELLFLHVCFLTNAYCSYFNRFGPQDFPCLSPSSLNLTLPEVVPEGVPEELGVTEEVPEDLRMSADGFIGT